MRGKVKFKKWAAAGVMTALLCGLLAGCRQDGQSAGTGEKGSAAGAASGEEKVQVRVGALKGPTSIGLLNLMEDSKQNETANEYNLQMATAADEILPLMVKGDLDIALVPANVAGVLYQKTEGNVCVIDINTLGVLYMVSGDLSVTQVADLKGRTVYLTGKGTTPDYCLQYLLKENGVDARDCTLEYKSEATEVAALLSEDTNAIGLLPQPFATVACGQNEALSQVLDMNEEWNRILGSGMVTGVTVVRRAFLEEHPEAVAAFLAEHGDSALAASEDVERTAELAVEAGIIAKEPIALAAIPKCNIVCITGEEMKEALSGYLEVLYGLEPASVGGALPAEDFYFIP